MRASPPSNTRIKLGKPLTMQGASEDRSLQNAASLPPVSRTGRLYLAVLFLLGVGFYALLPALFAAFGLLLVHVAKLTPSPLLLAAYAVACAVGMIFLLLLRSDEEPHGIQADLLTHRQLFALVDEVADRVGTDRIHSIYLTTSDEIGVWEEAALYLLPGAGRRKLVLGMAALNYLTLDQFRSVLAHEYGHFSHRDTFFSRFVYRVTLTYEAFLAQLRETPLFAWNPLCWLLRGYIWVYERAAAAFARSCEFRADRFAVEAYGKPLFVEAMVASYLESAFFRTLGLPQAIQRIAPTRTPGNLYHFVGVSRRVWEKEHPGQLRKVLGQLLLDKTRTLDLHPPLYERLRAQGMPTALVEIPPPPRLNLLQTLDRADTPDALPTFYKGKPSAAEALFGAEASAIQTRLSEILLLQSRFPHSPRPRP